MNNINIIGQKEDLERMQSKCAIRNGVPIRIFEKTQASSPEDQRVVNRFEIIG